MNMKNTDSEPALPDYLAPGLRVVSVGVNPSFASARAGFAFAHPRNRFWQALNRSRLVDCPLEPGSAAQQYLLEHYRFGFTDLVRRATAMEKDLGMAEIRQGALQLVEKMQAQRPAWIWFQGKTPANRFLQALGEPAIPGWGEMDSPLQGIRLFVSPNPSPANAAFSLDDLVGWYNRMAALLPPLER